MFVPQRYRACLIFLRKLHAHAAVKDNYYKILGVSPSASQAEIKSAYFELSKKHHPDRNQGSEESANIFRLIKTAYEVLGSEKTRLQYDKERIFNVVRKPLHTNQKDTRTDYTDDAERIHFQSRVRKPFRKYSQGRTTFYDFDAWYDGHYGKDSTEVFTFKEPRQFTTYQSHQVNVENKKQDFLKVKNLLFLVFYMVIILSGIKIGQPKEKRPITDNMWKTTFSLMSFGRVKCQEVKNDVDEK